MLAVWSANIQIFASGKPWLAQCRRVQKVLPSIREVSSMKIFVFVVLIGGAFCLGGCAPTATPQEVAAAHFNPLPKDYQQQIRNYMSSGLKDPYSAVYRFSIPRRGFVQDGALRGGKKHFGWVVTVYVNAKNSFGAYIGEERYMFIFTEGFLEPAGQSFELGVGAYVP